MLKVGIIGYGTIGEEVAQAIRRGEAGSSQLTSILVRDASRYADAAEYEWLEEAELFFSRELDLVVECAGHEAVERYGERALRHGADLIVVSVGALANEELLDCLKEAAITCNRKLYIPSSAVGGLDRIAAGSVGAMENVRLVTRKPPRAWYGTWVEQQVNLAELSEPYCIFEGAARDSARLFPESVNVSAALSLAGIGFERTKVQVWVDPGISHNTHAIEAKGKFGELKLHIQNTPSARNPKTGYIVAMSVIKTIRDMTSPIMIGI